MSTCVHAGVHSFHWAWCQTSLLFWAHLSYTPPPLSPDVLHRARFNSPKMDPGGCVFVSVCVLTCVCGCEQLLTQQDCFYPVLLSKLNIPVLGRSTPSACLISVMWHGDRPPALTHTTHYHCSHKPCSRHAGFMKSLGSDGWLCDPDSFMRIHSVLFPHVTPSLHHSHHPNPRTQFHSLCHLCSHKRPYHKISGCASIEAFINFYFRRFRVKECGL